MNSRKTTTTPMEMRAAPPMELASTKRGTTSAPPLDMPPHKRGKSYIRGYIKL